MMTKSPEHVVVIGGGLAGSLFALKLAQRGHRVDVYERRSDPRRDVAREGRSINLGLSKRGIQALAEVGLHDILSVAVPMSGRVIHALDGTQRFHAYGKNRQEVLHSIDRNELNELLLDRAEAHEGVTLHFDHRCVAIDKEKREVTIEAPDGSMKRVRPDWVVGADGAFSKVREEMQRGERASFSREFLEWGYKELTLSAGANGASRIMLNALHVWPRGHCLIVSHANRDGSHTLTLFLPFDGPDSFASVRTADDVVALFNKYFPDLVPIVPDLVEQWMNRPTGSLVTTRTGPWHHRDWLVLIGDACHAVYPFYGQGMNSAFEDCSALGRELERHSTRADALRAYEEARKPHTDTLAELSKANFLELRQKVSSPLFVLRKRIDVWLNWLLPNAWLPLYTMIAHTTIPYREALHRARRQERVLWSSLAVAALAVVGVLGWLVR